MCIVMDGKTFLVNFDTADGAQKLVEYLQLFGKYRFAEDYVD